MKIEVKQEHIDRGVSKNCGLCPGALALKDAGFNQVLVSCTQIYPTSYALGCYYIPEVAAFIEAFDQNQPVSSFTFDLPVPEPTHAN